jgi:hypothetical protein
VTALPYAGAPAYDRPEPPAPPSFIGKALRAVEEPARETGSKIGRSLARRWASFKAVSGTVIGFSSFTAAAFQAGTITGLVVAGVSCLVIEWRVRG